MFLILSYVDNADQHDALLNANRKAYKPVHCPHCSACQLWCHGTYMRQSAVECKDAPRRAIAIPRFFCVTCEQTCSTLPEFIAPRRWYHWAVQQVVFLLLLSKETLLEVWSSLFDRQPRGPSQATIQRWHRQFRADYDLHRLHLCSQLPELGYTADFTDFWQACLQKIPLASAMSIVYRSEPSNP